MASHTKPFTDEEMDQIDALREKDRNTLLKERMNKLQTELKGIKGRERSKIPSSSEYIRQLQELDFRDEDAVVSFLRSTRPTFATMPPVRLYVAGEHLFMIQSNNEVPNCQEWDHPQPREISVPQHDEIVHFVPEHITGQYSSLYKLDFGIVLGALVYCEVTDREIRESRDFPWEHFKPLCRETGYYVVINVVDDSMWLVLDFDALDDLGEPGWIIPESPNWGHFPNNKRGQAGVLRISDKGWRQNWGIKGNPFGDERFSDTKVAPYKMVGSPAARSDVRKALGQEA